MRVYGAWIKDIAFYVQKYIAHGTVCYNFPLVRDKPQGALAFARLVFWTIGEKSVKF